MAAPLVLMNRGDPNQMIAASVWDTTGSLKDLKQLRALNVAAQIMQTRLYDRFRESEGGTYTPGVNNGQSEVFPHFGVFIAYSQIKAERLADFRKATLEIAQALAKDGPTEDELARAARAPIVSGNEQRRKLNLYWAQMLQGDLDDPQYLTLIRTGVTGYQDVTTADVKAMAKRWLAKAPALQIQAQGAPKSDMRRRAFLIAVIGLCAATTAGAQGDPPVRFAGPEIASIPLRRAADGKLYLTVQVMGRGLVMFIDTGASTVMDINVARALGGRWRYGATGVWTDRHGRTTDRDTRRHAAGRDRDRRPASRLP